MSYRNIREVESREEWQAEMDIISQEYLKQEKLENKMKYQENVYEQYLLDMKRLELPLIFSPEIVEYLKQEVLKYKRSRPELLIKRNKYAS